MSKGAGVIGTDVYEQILDSFQAIFGPHPGYRPVHAKGVVCDGTFQATAAARTLTRAPHMQGGEIPAMVRFSDSGGIPTVADGDPLASPHGIGIRFQLPDKSSTDLVAHSHNGFPTRDAEEFLDFIRAVASSGPGAPSPSPIERFLADHPAAKRFVEAPKPAPESFATEAFYAVHAFKFTNQAGRSQFGRYRILPVAGERHLDAAEAAKRPANYLFDDLTQRLARSPVEFRLMVQLAVQGDPVEDPTQLWPEDRQLIEVGRLAVIRQRADSDAVQPTFAFDPARLPDGIAPGDSLLEARSAIYGLALKRRQT